MTNRFGLLLWACASLLLPLPSCETVDPRGDPGQVAESSRAAKGLPSSRHGPLRLAPRSLWVHLNPAGPALFSPQASPDGRWVAASARGGVGLYVADVAGKAPLRTVDPARLGPWAWSSGPVALLFGGDVVKAYLPHRGSVSPSGGRRPWDRPWDEELGELVQDGRGGRWYHHPRKGTVTRAPAGRPGPLVVAEDAWGATVSPEGRYLAYSKGHLSNSRFFVHDAKRDLTRELGPGVHPIWLPGRDAVIYAVPAGVERFSGIANVTGSDLWLYDFDTGEHRALTATRDLAEMEPALGPTGDAVLWADWQGGGIWRAPLWGGGAP